MRKVMGDAKIRGLATSFFAAADAAHISDMDITNVLQSKPWFMYNGLLYERTASLADAQYALVTAVLKSLGSQVSNDKQIESIAWDVATGSSTTENKPNTFATAIDGEASKQYERVEACFSVRLQGISNMKVGLVSIEIADNIAKQLNRQDNRWRIEPGKRPGTKYDGNTLVISFPNCITRTSVTGFKGNVPDQAAWLVNVATTLLRLSIPPNKRVANFPHIGAVEASATAIPSREDTGLTLYEGGASLGGSSLLG